MSLINDALKRASQKPPQPVETSNNLEPVDYPQEHKVPLIRIIAAAGLVILGVGGWFGWQVLKNMQAKSASAAVKVAARTNSVPTTAAATNTVVANAPAVPAATPAPATKATATTPTKAAATKPTRPATNTVAKPAAAPATKVAKKPAAALVATVQSHEEPAAVPFPKLKLQGIFYRPNKPSALINNKTVYQGDHIGDVKVVTIQQSYVIVEFNGESRRLTL